MNKLTKFEQFIEDNHLWHDADRIEAYVEEVKKETLQAVREEIEKKKVEVKDCKARGYDEVCDRCYHIMGCEFAGQDKVHNQALDDLLKSLAI